MFGAARAALVVIDPHTDCITRWNPAAERLFGYVASEVIGHTIQAFMPPELARLHRERMARYVRDASDSKRLSRLADLVEARTCA